MQAIPYVPPDLAEPADLIAAIRHRRGGSLLNLDRMLLHSPPLARGWNVFLGEVRNNLSVPAVTRELAMTYVAVLNGATYEYAHHAPRFLAAGGREAVLDAMATDAAAPGCAGLDESDRALLQLTLEMTRQVSVMETTRAAAHAALGSERALVELIAVIAAYNMVSRFLVATGVGLED